MVESDILKNVNDAQIQAILHDAGPLLIVAGAGTGKTTVLTRRYVHILQEKKLKTENILALTFTEKSANEMEDRVLQQLPNGSFDFWISTFHSFCQRILEQYGLEIGLPNRFKLINETDAWLILKRRIEELPLTYYKPLGNPTKFLSALQKHISRAKDEGVSPEMYAIFANQVEDAEEKIRLSEIAACYKKYRDILREEGALDFGDLIVETLRLLKERPRVLKELQCKFQYILIDEFQDTNWAQYEMLKLLAGEKKNITVVGDDDQAIYKFRGASLANILQFRDDFPESRTVALTQNYRSHQEILSCAYGFIQKNNPNRLEVRLQNTGLNKLLISAKGIGGEVDVVWFKTLEDEAEGVAMRIKEIKESDQTVHWNDFAILSRSNAGCEPFIDALDRHHIPFRFMALRGLYAKPLILDIIALFSMCDGYAESVSVWQALLAPCFHITTLDIEGYIEYARKKTSGSLWKALQNFDDIEFNITITKETQDKIKKFVDTIKNLQVTALRERPIKILQSTLNETGYLKLILKKPEAERIEQIGYLNAFASRIKRYEQNTHAPTLKHFMEELRAEIDSGEEGALQTDSDAGPEYVSVMTVHASKGLEFKHVYIVSMVDQKFPSRTRTEEIPLPDGLINERLEKIGDAHIEEERRLLYVAMTRAKNTLTCTGADAYGGIRKKKPSVFLEEAQLDVPVSEEVSDTAGLEISHVEHPAEKGKLFVYNVKRRFSFTQLAAYKKCPKQYQFGHIYKIPILGNHQKNFGQCIHTTLHQLLQPILETGRGIVSVPDALIIYEKQWNEFDSWYPSEAERLRYYTEGREGIIRFVEQCQKELPRVAFLEHGFTWQQDELSIKGSVDRIDILPGGGHIIYDYKTGASKELVDLGRDQKEQLWIYQIAMEEMGLDIRTLCYIYIQDGSTAYVPILQGEKKEEFKRELIERMKHILQDSNFLASPSTFVCTYCDFKNICEFRRL